MQLSLSWLSLGLVLVVGCSGSFTRAGDDPLGGGSGGTGATAGEHGVAGASGSVSSGGAPSGGGTVGYGASGGLGGIGGAIYVGGFGGDISIGGTGAGGSACGDVAPPANPYPVDFVFTSNTPVYVKNSCSLSYELYSCWSGTSAIAREAGCVADCNSASTGCVACADGACANAATLVGPNAPLKDHWTGMTYTYGTLPAGCSCASAAPATAGVYRLSISVYLSEQDALMGTNPYPVNIQFTLPAPSNVVNVDLGFEAI